MAESAQPVSAGQPDMPAAFGSRHRSLWYDAFQRLIRNKAAVAGLLFILFIVFVAIFADAIAPYSYREQDLQATYQFPSREHPLGTNQYGKDVLSVRQFNREDLEYIFAVAHEMRVMVERIGTFDLLKGKILANLFYEPSTRTSSSFTAAMERLGGSVIPINEVRYSSVSKHEKSSSPAPGSRPSSTASMAKSRTGRMRFTWVSSRYSFFMKSRPARAISVRLSSRSRYRAMVSIMVEVEASV